MVNEMNMKLTLTTPLELLSILEHDLSISCYLIWTNFCQLRVHLVLSAVVSYVFVFLLCQ